MTDRELSNCKKIGIMGGTFNPIHTGHLLMARWALESAGLDAILFIPAGNPYMKSNTDILDGEQRMQMVRMSIQGQDDFFVSDMELKRNGNTYTYETLLELRRLYPQAKLYFIMGADSLYTFAKWSHPELILANSILIAAARNGTSMEQLEEKRRELTTSFGGEILLMEFPAIDISSTMIRDRLKEGKSIRYLTTDAVCDYIASEKVYVK